MNLPRSSHDSPFAKTSQAPADDVSFAERSRIEDTSFDLVTQMSQINLTRAEASLNQSGFNASALDETKFKQTSETSARFYSQLFDVLKRRQNVPNQKVNLNKLELLDSKFDQSTSTQVIKFLLSNRLSTKLLNFQFSRENFFFSITEFPMGIIL